jgi:FKBP-type peptidyl-prolyl cis-trans isomerase SlyD
VVVTPEEGYGTKREDLIITVPREHWSLPETVGVGEIVELQSDAGQRLPARIVDMKPEAITLDANHPLAGEALHFEITLVSVRPATEEEVEHGHAHGPGGHQH